MSNNNIAHTVNNRSANTGVIDKQEMSLMTENSILNTQTPLAGLGTIGTGWVNVDPYTTIYINCEADVGGTLQIILANNTAFGGFARTYNVVANQPLVLRIPLNARRALFLYTNGAGAQAFFSLGIFSEAIAGNGAQYANKLFLGETHANLGMAGTFIGEFQPTIGYRKAIVSGFTSHPGSVFFVYSDDGVTTISSRNIVAVIPGGFSLVEDIAYPYVRAEYLNGGAATTTFDFWASLID